LEVDAEVVHEKDAFVGVENAGEDFVDGDEKSVPLSGAPCGTPLD